MAYILSLETSGNSCSVAMHQDGVLVVFSQVTEPQAHAAKLAGLIDEVVTKAAVTFNDVSAVAITSGPGSYTGLRIGTSTAKGLCYALSIPLIAVGTLELMIYQARKTHPNGLFCAMIDARRMEVYSLLADATGRILKSIQAEVIDANSYTQYLDNEQVFFFGSGAEKCEEVITHANAQFASGMEADALSLGEVAYQKFVKGQFDDLIHFEPFYLKEFQIKKSSKPQF